jgi:hypothetical protein
LSILTSTFRVSRITAPNTSQLQRRRVMPVVQLSLPLRGCGMHVPYHVRPSGEVRRIVLLSFSLLLLIPGRAQTFAQNYGLSLNVQVFWLFLTLSSILLRIMRYVHYRSLAFPFSSPCLGRKTRHVRTTLNFSLRTDSVPCSGCCARVRLRFRRPLGFRVRHGPSLYRDRIPPV